MVLYKYRAYDKNGKIDKGYLSAESESEVINFLTNTGFIPIKVNVVKSLFLIRFYNFLFRRISLNQKIYLARNLYLILKSGLNLSRGLEILISESKGGLKTFLLYLKYFLEKGEPFYRVFMSFPEFFSPIEIEMIRAGEVAGTLQNNLLRWAENLERARDIRREIISDIIYPIIVIILAIGVLAFLFLFVLPRIAQLLEQLTKEPPQTTKIILSISKFTRENFFQIIYSLVGFSVAVFIFLASKIGKKFVKNLVIRLPLFKVLFLYLSLADALFVIKSLISSGVHLTDAFRLTSGAVGHPQLRDAFLRIEKYVKTGVSIAEALRREEVIPSILANVLGIAAESGAFSEILDLMEDFYRTEARLRLKTLLTLLEPALLIFLGIIVAFVAISVIVPIYQQISRQLEIQRERQMTF